MADEVVNEMIIDMGNGKISRHDLVEQIKYWIAAERKKAWNEAIEKAAKIPHQRTLTHGYYAMGPSTIEKVILNLKLKESEE